MAREWTEKYRPYTLDEVVGQDRVISTLKKHAKHPIEEIPNMIFVGKYGTGKTSVARAFCREARVHFIEKNVALEFNKEDIETLEKVFQMRSNMNDFEEGEGKAMKTDGQIFILDEAEAIKSTNLSALRKVLENGSGNSKVIVICNDDEKFQGAIRSRLTRFVFRDVEEADMEKLIRSIASKEKLEVPDNVVQEIIKESEGVPRNAVKALYQYKVMSE